jgi:hypothetical protein
LFDASIPDEMTAARALWRQVAAGGHHAQYWQQDGGPWVKKTAVNGDAAG